MLRIAVPCCAALCSPGKTTRSWARVMYAREIQRAMTAAVTLALPGRRATRRYATPPLCGGWGGMGGLGGATGRLGQHGRLQPDSTAGSEGSRGKGICSAAPAQGPTGAVPHLGKLFIVQAPVHLARSPAVAAAWGARQCVAHYAMLAWGQRQHARLRGGLLAGRSALVRPPRLPLRSPCSAPPLLPTKALAELLRKLHASARARLSWTPRQPQQRALVPTQPIPGPRLTSSTRSTAPQSPRQGTANPWQPP